MADELNVNVNTLTVAVDRLTSVIGSVIGGGGGAGGGGGPALSERAFFLASNISNLEKASDKQTHMLALQKNATLALKVVIAHTFSRWSSLQTKAAALSRNTASISQKLVRSQFEGRLAVHALQTEMLRLRSGLDKSGKFTAELSDKTLSLGENIGGLMQMNVAMSSRLQFSSAQSERLTKTMLLTGEKYGRSTEDLVRAVNDLGTSFLDVAGVMGFGGPVLDVQQRLIGVLGERGAAPLNKLLRQLGSTDPGDIQKVLAMGLGDLQRSVLDGTVTVQKVVSEISKNRNILGEINTGSVQGLLQLNAQRQLTGDGVMAMKQLANMFDSADFSKVMTDATETEKSWRETVRFKMEQATDSLLNISNVLFPALLPLVGFIAGAVGMLLPAIASYMLLSGGGRAAAGLAASLGMGAGAAAGAAGVPFFQRMMGRNKFYGGGQWLPKSAWGRSGAVAVGKGFQAPAGGMFARQAAGRAAVGGIGRFAGRALGMINPIFAGISALVLAWTVMPQSWKSGMKEAVGLGTKEAMPASPTCPPLPYLEATNQAFFDARTSLLREDIGGRPAEDYSAEMVELLRGIHFSSQTRTTIEQTKAAQASSSRVDR